LNVPFVRDFGARDGNHVFNRKVQAIVPGFPKFVLHRNGAAANFELEVGAAVRCRYARGVVAASLAHCFAVDLLAAAIAISPSAWRRSTSCFRRQS
jgi:hypothetical protein